MSVTHEGLLDHVQAVLDSKTRKRIKAGKDGYIYRLSGLLYSHDDHKYHGYLSGKYRYYFNQAKGRIRADEIEDAVIKEIKSQVLSDKCFAELVTASIKRRQSALPKVEERIRETQKAILELDDKNSKLRDQFLKRERLNDKIVTWLSDEVEKIQQEQLNKTNHLEELKKLKGEIFKESGLGNIQELVQKALDGFDSMTRFQQRTILQKLIDRVTVMPNNTVEITLTNPNQHIGLEVLHLSPLEASSHKE